MTSNRQIIIELRAQAQVSAERGQPDAARSLQKGADEIERLNDELFYLRAYIEGERTAA